MAYVTAVVTAAASIAVGYSTVNRTAPTTATAVTTPPIDGTGFGTAGCSLVAFVTAVLVVDWVLRLIISIQRGGTTISVI